MAAHQYENTFCSFVTDDIIGYGQIEFFIPKPVPQALINVFSIDEVSMMASSGNPCRPQLIVYKEVDYISTFVKPISISTISNLHLVSITDIIGKPVRIKTSTRHYFIHQPNYDEHHVVTLISGYIVT